MTLPTPEQLAKAGTEESQQTAFFAWAALNATHLPLLRTAFHIANGSLRDKVTASRLKAAGVRAGVWDVLLPVSDASGAYKGLWLEFKRHPNKLTDEQIQFQINLAGQHWAWFVSYTWYDAAQATERYLLKGWDLPKDAA
jgi:hypothetical protein